MLESVLLVICPPVKMLSSDVAVTEADKIDGPVIQVERNRAARRTKLKFPPLFHSRLLRPRL